MNDHPQIMGQSQILHNHQNYVVWSRYPPENSAMFTFNASPALFPPASHPGQVSSSKDFRWNGPLGTGTAANRSGSKGRRFYRRKKKFGGGGARFAAPFAPRNTTSFIIRAKKSGGIASLVSPEPVTPAILPTPKMSPSREVVVDMAKEEWGVDGYGSMKGLIRLRSWKGENESSDEDSGDEIGGSGSDVEECVEFEKKLDHDLSRFEMIYPNSAGNGGYNNNALENRVDDQDTQISQLEEENLTLKERIFIMERELGELRRRVQCLETDGVVAGGCREVMVPDGVEDDFTLDVCSEMSVGNGNGGGGGGGGGDDGDVDCDCV